MRQAPDWRAGDGWGAARSTTGGVPNEKNPVACPPGRGARVSEAAGQVWVYSPDAGEWVSAERNQPLTSGDRIATDTGARAELQIGSTSLRLDSGTEVEVVQPAKSRAMPLTN